MHPALLFVWLGQCNTDSTGKRTVVPCTSLQNRECEDVQRAGQLTSTCSVLGGGLLATFPNQTLSFLPRAPFLLFSAAPPDRIPVTVYGIQVGAVPRRTAPPPAPACFPA